MFIKTLKPHKFHLLILALFLSFFFIFGIIFPDTFWANHFWSFLPNSFKIGIPVFIIGFLVAVQHIKEPIAKKKIPYTNFTVFLISVVLGILFYHFNIIDDYYGDAKNFSPLITQKVIALPQNFWRDLFSIQLKTGQARWGVFNLYSLIAYIFHTNIASVFKMANAIFGMGFIYIWGVSIKKHLTHYWLQISFLIIGITSPSLLIFYGHIETYSLNLFLLIFWIYSYTIAFKKRDLLLFTLLIPLLLVGIRFNTLFVFLIPAHILGIIFSLFPKSTTLINRFFTTKNLFIYIFTPLVVLGGIAYFFIFEAYNDSRILESSTRDIDRLFLPLFSPNPPLDNYNLLSWNHIFDFLQVFFIWSPAMLFLIGLVFIKGKRKKIESPLIAILLITLFLFLGFLFMINPLMSLPMDWDLYCLPLPIAFITLLLFFESIQNDFPSFKVALYIVGLCALNMATFIVPMNTKMHSYRLESVGVRVFKTYYQHADEFLLYALQRIRDDTLYKERKTNLIQKLKPYINHPYDVVYANLLLDEGINAYANKKYIEARNLFLSALRYDPRVSTTHNFIKKANYKLFSNGYQASKRHKESSDSLVTTGLYASKATNLHEKALKDFERAAYYNPRNPRVSMAKMEINFNLKRFDKALENAKQLIAFQFPTAQLSLRIGMHCALEAEAYDEALVLSKKYIQQWPEDQLIQVIHTSLKNNDNVSQLKYKFAQH